MLIEQIIEISIEGTWAPWPYIYSASSIIRTSFIRHSIIRPLGQIIIYDITMKCYFHTILLKTC